MDEKLRQLLEQLPERPPRSKLEPHAEIIWELRKKRRTYEEIAAFLREHVEVTAAASTIYEFVKRRAKQARPRAATKPEVPAPLPSATRPESPSATPPVPSADAVRERLRALKQQPATALPEPKRFTFDAEEPLVLRPERKEK